MVDGEDGEEQWTRALKWKGRGEKRTGGFSNHKNKIKIKII